MGRPKKPVDQKLIPAKTTLTPAIFDRLDRVAREEGWPLSKTIRMLIDRTFREPKTGL